jgi:ABC-type uncharacterized transport system permease subunit
MKATAKKEPLIRIAKKSDIPFGKKALITSLCLFAALAVSILFLWVVSMKDPFIALKYIFEGTFEINTKGFSTIKLWAAVKEIVILLAVALALTPAYKMKFWNVGAQGQILMGALASAVTMIYLDGKAPSWAIILLGIVSSLLSGALWAWIPAFFKARFNTNETLFTLMMNYLSVLTVTLCYNVWKGSASSMRNINSQDEAGYFPSLAGNNVLLPLLLVLVLAVTMYVYLHYTKHGYEINVVGDSISTARYTGINVRHVIRRTVALSGALAGIVGYFYVACFDHVISPTTSGSYGFTAIIVCWLSGFNPFIMIGYSALMIFLDKGARNLSNVSYSPMLNEYSTQFVVFAVIVAIMLAKFHCEYTVIFRKKTSAEIRRASLTKGLLGRGA